jgi:hypothetical protein
MLLRKLKSPVMAVPAGLSMVVGGLLLIMISIALPYLGHPFPAGIKVSGDFIRRFLIGFGITMEIMGLGTILPALFVKREPSAASRD